MAEVRGPCEVLFNKPDEFYVTYPEMGPEEILDVMESFDRIQPLSVKCSSVVFLCSCRHCYQNYVCIESAVLSLLYNSELEVPDIARLKQIKERERTELANPFNAKKLKEKASKAVEKAAEVEPSHPCLLVGTCIERCFISVAERHTQSLKDCSTRGFCAVFPSSEYAARDSRSSASEARGSQASRAV